jgi:hypothetical protein
MTIEGGFGGKGAFLIHSSSIKAVLRLYCYLPENTGYLIIIKENKSLFHLPIFSCTNLFQHV